VGYSSWDDLKNQEDYPIPKNEKLVANNFYIQGIYFFIKIYSVIASV